MPPHRKAVLRYTYKIPGALRPEQVIKLIPKDILIFNWFWNDMNNDKQLSAFGFRQVYGNFRPDMNNWKDRDSIKGVVEGAPSSWAATTQYNFGKDQLFDFLADANLLWSTRYLPIDKVVFATEPLVNDIYRNLSGKNLPSDNGSTVSSVNISSHFNSSLSEGIVSFNNSNLITGEVKSGNKIFVLNSPADAGKKAMIATDEKNKAVPKQNGIAINKDVSSIIFLHACAKEASNDKAYRMIYNFDDTADPLGYYEVVYEDRLVETIPIRYGVNILDWQWRQRINNNEKEDGKYSQNKYAYKASAVDCSKDTSDPVTFFAFEWHNTRFGKKVKEVNLKPVSLKKAKKMLLFF